MIIALTNRLWVLKWTPVDLPAFSFTPVESSGIQQQIINLRNKCKCNMVSSRMSENGVGQMDPGGHASSFTPLGGLHFLCLCSIYTLLSNLHIQTRSPTLSFDCVSSVKLQSLSLSLCYNIFFHFLAILLIARSVERDKVKRIGSVFLIIVSDHKLL